MNINKIEFTGVKTFFTRQLKNLGWVFFVVFLLLLVMEAFEIKQSVDIILSSNQDPPAVITSHGVRINFDNYDKAASRIQNGQTFVPSHGITKNPFGSGR